MVAVSAEPTRGIKRLIMHELSTGALMGITCGILIGLGASLVIKSQSPPPGNITPMHLGAVVAAALFAAMTFAAMFGTLVPVVLNKINIDPAVASGPFITIANDIVALLIYFAVTILMLNVITL